MPSTSRIAKRIDHLDAIEAQARALRNQAEERGGAIVLIRDVMARWGCVLEANESLAEAFMRSVGITCQELKSGLHRRI